MAFCQQAVMMTGIDILLQAFLERHGPYTCLVDGANVAMFGQNWEDGETGKKGGFRFDQIEAVMDQIALERPNLKPLLVRGPSLFTVLSQRPGTRALWCTRDAAGSLHAQHAHWLQPLSVISATHRAGRAFSTRFIVCERPVA
jgi:hypothetical protein